MGGVPVKHHTSSKVGRRRSHMALKKANLSVCGNCQAPAVGHRYCGQCGYYKSKPIKEPKIKIKKTR
ncbi:MAG: 50S ribosomal protein L32 [Parcubacteria group bacterium]|nr:50S ribosomal protein L32 [Parcubacteria group bacterium]